MSNKEMILNLVKYTPAGKVVSYGQIARITGMNARIVGFILSGINELEMAEYPWHRVVNRDGFISASKLGDKGKLQQALLEAEGLEIIEFQIINPNKYWWTF